MLSLESRVKVVRRVEDPAIGDKGAWTQTLWEEACEQFYYLCLPCLPCQILGEWAPLWSCHLEKVQTGERKLLSLGECWDADPFYDSSSPIMLRNKCISLRMYAMTT